MIFHRSSASRFDETKRCLCQLLNSSTTFDDVILDNLIQQYIARCESNSLYEWRYYFIKYPVFRPNKFGKYWIKVESKNCMYALWTQHKVSENAFQPYLKVIDSHHLDSEKYGQRLAINGQFIYCEKDIFVLKDKDDNEIKALVINQNSDNVDTEGRIAKYLANPLV